MSEHVGATDQWMGREVVDTGGRSIGPVVGRAYARKRFGITWLLVRTAEGRTVLAPAEQMQGSGERLILPYSATYVEAAPALTEGAALAQAEERRLRLHYGIASGGPDGGCRAGCGLCMVNRRELRRGAAHACRDDDGDS